MFMILFLKYCLRVILALQVCQKVKIQRLFFVDDFEKHLPNIEWFHRRYMCSNHATRAWVETIKDLDIQMIAPQHGPIYKGQAVHDFIAWFKELRCGIDLMSAGGNFEKEARDA